MVAYARHIQDIPPREIGAGALAAVAALVVSLLYLPAPGSLTKGLSSGAAYWFVYAPGFAFVAGFIVGTVVWRRTMSRESTPRQGVRAGIVTAVGTVVLVPILIGLYVILFPLLLSVVTGQDWNYALALYPAHLWISIGFTRALAVSWSPLVGAVLVPIGALIGWMYQGGLRWRGR